MIHICNLGDEVRQEPCGCGLLQCSICGVYFSHNKCDFHKPVQANIPPEEYYLQRLGTITDGLPRHKYICDELLTALSDMGVSIPEGLYRNVLDIGAGLGVYAPLFMNKHYSYTACENDSWACNYIKGAYDANVVNESFESFEASKGSFSAIVASHVLEHFKDPKSMLIKMYEYLTIEGRLYLVVPDSSDLCNPDHLTFFNEKGLAKWVEECGFKNVKSIQKKIVEREDYIFLVAEKA